MVDFCGGGRLETARCMIPSHSINQPNNRESECLLIFCPTFPIRTLLDLNDIRILSVCNFQLASPDVCYSNDIFLDAVTSNLCVARIATESFSVLQRPSWPASQKACHSLEMVWPQSHLYASPHYLFERHSRAHEHLPWRKMSAVSAAMHQADLIRTLS